MAATATTACSRQKEHGENDEVVQEEIETTRPQVDGVSHQIDRFRIGERTVLRRGEGQSDLFDESVVRQREGYAMRAFTAPQQF